MNKWLRREEKKRYSEAKGVCKSKFTCILKEKGILLVTFSLVNILFSYERIYTDLFELLLSWMLCFCNCILQQSIGVTFQEFSTEPFIQSMVVECSHFIAHTRRYLISVKFYLVKSFLWYCLYLTMNYTFHFCTTQLEDWSHDWQVTQFV